MSELKIETKSVVVPGQVLAQGMEYLPGVGTYRKDDTILANRVGVAILDGKVIRTIPLAGKYLPKRNDVIVGRVIDIISMGWRVELNSPYTGLIPIRDGTFEFIPKGADLSRYYDIGDYFVGKITNVSGQNLIDVSVKGPGLYKLRGGRIIKVNTNKVPRIIGKKGSMVSMIKKATGCKITVGQNGWIWVSGEPASENLAIQTINKIESESHISGLTDRIKSFLEGETGLTNLDEPAEFEKENKNSEQNTDSQSANKRGDRSE